jgi:hypothetical protein
MPWLDLLQWPAMVATLLGSWYVASNDPRRRNLAFWIFLLSNVLWALWGLYAQAYALIVLQIGLLLINIRGARKTDAGASSQAPAP